MCMHSNSTSDKRLDVYIHLNSNNDTHVELMIETKFITMLYK